MEVIVNSLGQTEIPLSLFPKDGTEYESRTALKNGQGFKARRVGSDVVVKGKLALKPGQVEVKPAEEHMAEIDKIVNATISKFDLDTFNEYNIEPTAGRMGSVAKGTRRSRALSLSGRLSAEATNRFSADFIPDAIDSPDKLTRGQRHSRDAMPTQEGETEELVRHLDSTFNNTLMLLTNRLTRLDMTLPADLALSCLVY